MPLFAANLTMMFTEKPFMERFAAAAAAGFREVEYLFPYDHSAEAIAAALEVNGLRQALFNCPPGDWEAGERGLACLPGREAEFEASLDTALAYAEIIGVPRLHLMAGLGSAADPEQRATYLRSVARAAERLDAAGLQLVLEPINPIDMPGYFLNDFDLAAAIIAEVGAPNVALQFDFYHCQRIHGDLCRRFGEMAAITGHVQIAGVPGRHEPDVGEIRYDTVFALLDRLDYRGAVGCEYRPAGETEAGLGWFHPWRAPVRA
ncbi:hydroxypyruvate isomerase family protein (plasmid) [Paroceanicella profunda]|uniref:Hydroxypyruvate isomerase family protein n=1 Tax=Paroceanicella profunda TaxID=2579971 RepID=A0A5B8G2E1_9RHOB|nr:2-oxo-tetronate isomerase [Paroceanicella profunda]QDL94244.1 hydroxypyruvate isomerase family protein [Paroceanicella profunda]